MALRSGCQTVPRSPGSSDTRQGHRHVSRLRGLNFDLNPLVLFRAALVANLMLWGPA